MSNSKLTDSEIAKALECCSKTTLKEMCVDCPAEEKGICTEIDLKELALDLINRLQAKNKNLQERNVILRGLVDTQKAENEDIKFLYENLKEEHLEIIKAIKHTKAEAYKEFAERLKMRAINRYNECDNQEYPYATITHIDNLLKETVGE